MSNPAETYRKNAQNTGSPRELEAQLLMRAASKLQAIKDGEVTQAVDVMSALRYNRRLWLVFASALGRAENKLPVEIKRNVSSLAVFVLNRSRILETSSQISPDRLGILININRELAAGLRSNAQAAA